MRRRELILGGAVGALAPLLPRGARAEGVLQQLDTPQDLATPLEAYDSLLTPVERFFVRSHFGAPSADPARKLRVVGSKATLELSADDLAKMPQQAHVAVLQCSGNGRSLHSPRVPGLQWVHGAMGQAEWRGVRLADLLDKAGVAAGMLHIKVQGYDLPPKPSVPAYVRSVPLERAMDATTLVATHMNGKPLTHAHGAPFRLVVPGWSGNHWMKWLKLLQPSAQEAEGFYQRTAYRMPKQPVAPGAAVKPEDTVPATAIPVKSVIARPGEGGEVKAGRAEVVGVAFSGEAPLAKVEVSFDGGQSWVLARLEGQAGVGRWQVFRVGFDAGPGQGRAMARATDAKGNAQPQNAVWNPSGYFWNGWHSVSFKVIA
jgi:DMSO/TMAO reductase YedYZ molybdopterin-dependent catalytic subunit